MTFTRIHNDKLLSIYSQADKCESIVMCSLILTKGRNGEPRLINDEELLHLPYCRATATFLSDTPRILFGVSEEMKSSTKRSLREIRELQTRETNPENRAESMNRLLGRT